MDSSTEKFNAHIAFLPVPITERLTAGRAAGERDSVSRKSSPRQIATLHTPTIPKAGRAGGNAIASLALRRTAMYALPAYRQYHQAAEQG